MRAELAAALAERESLALYRRRHVLQGAQGPEVVVDGKPMLGFCSNDYLGLANHPEVVAAARAALERYGVGAGASHLVCGHGAEHHALEEELAAFTGRPRALLFSTGYMANFGIVTALLGREDAVFEDRLNHASLLDAGLMSGARFQRFAHNDMADLRRRLGRTTARRKLVTVDAVFSMDGDCAPLPELAATAHEQGAWLMADDAHGFGVLGANGRGTAEHFGLGEDDLPIYMATLGKAVGSFGAFVAGSEELVETVIQFARSYIYTTALPPAIAAATRAALGVIVREGWRRQHLADLVDYFRAGATQLGLPLLDSFTPIQPVVLGDERRTLQASEALAVCGIWVSAIRPPTVPRGTARLRITLTAAHDRAQVDRLLDALAAAVPRADER